MNASSAKAQPVIYFQCGDFDMRWFVDVGAGKTNVTMVDKGKTKTFPDFNVPYSSTSPNSASKRKTCRASQRLPSPTYAHRAIRVI